MRKSTKKNILKLQPNKKKNHDSTKAMLAKLLAAEDISVIHGNFSTGSFNLKTRELRLPSWRNLGEDVHDLLVLHEVAHALYTPAEGFHSSIVNDDRGPRFKTFLNVVEDVRIEKKIKRTYPGAHAPMLRGYDIIMEKDLFGVKNSDIDELSLIDRINLHFKLGSYLPIEFKNQTELDLVKKTSNVETWEDVVEVSNLIWDYCSEEIQKIANIDDFDYDGYVESEDGDLIDPDTTVRRTGQSQGTESNNHEYNSSDSGDQNEPNQNQNKLETNNNEEQKSDNKDENGQLGGSSKLYEGLDKIDPNPVGPVSITDQTWQQNQKGIVDPDAVYDCYATLPDIKYKDFFVPYSEIERRSYQVWKNDQNGSGVIYEKEGPAIWRKVRAKNKKAVDYLAKEFEMRKRANEYVRSKTAKTGSIDSSKVWKYKISEDIFNRVTTVPEGKSHGMVMLLDWSSSMSPVIESAIEQVLVLSMFCKKVGIPFKILAFTDSFYRSRESEYFPGRYENYRYDEFKTKFKDGDLAIGDFNLLEVLSSSMKASEFTRAAELLCLIAQFYHKYKSRFYYQNKENDNIWKVNYVGGGVPSFLNLGGTPLNSALMSMPNFIEEFKESFGIDIVNLILITDGDSQTNENILGNAATNQDSNKHNPFGSNTKNYWLESQIKNNDGYYTTVDVPVTKQDFANSNRYYYWLNKYKEARNDEASYKHGIIDPETKVKVLYDKYRSQNNFRAQTNVLIDLIKARTGATIVNFYITSSSNHGIRRWMNTLETYDKKIKEFRKRKSVVLDGDCVDSYDSIYVIGEKSLTINDDELVIDNTKSRVSMAKEFKKFFSGKLTQRILLTEFVKMIS